MSDSVQKVPYGYEPPKNERKGTIIFYDAFEHISDHELDLAAQIAVQRSFAKLVLYPLHEESVRRMSKEAVSPFYKRDDRLYEWKVDRNLPYVFIERFEAKRKKYTPMDYALRHLANIYPAPYFLYITGEMANAFASYSSFEDWIVKIRLLIISEPSKLHPRLLQYEHRWELVTRE